MDSKLIPLFFICCVFQSLVAFFNPLYRRNALALQPPKQALYLSLSITIVVVVVVVVVVIGDDTNNIYILPR